ncbi:MAG: hypothetical protein P5685_24400, partial [Limnospira sp. PMC 1261.20]
METTPFYILLFFHLSFLILGFGSVLVTDLFGLLWMRDHIRFKQIVHISGITGYFVWAGWAGMLLTGIPLAILKGDVDELMILKFFFVLLIGLNGILLHGHQRRLKSFKTEDEVSNLFMFRLGFSLFVSQLAWWGAIVIGFLHRHIWTTIAWPPR